MVQEGESVPIEGKKRPKKSKVTFIESAVWSASPDADSNMSIVKSVPIRTKKIRNERNHLESDLSPPNTRVMGVTGGCSLKEETEENFANVAEKISNLTSHLDGASPNSEKPKTQRKENKLKDAVKETKLRETKPKEKEAAKERSERSENKVRENKVRENKVRENKVRENKVRENKVRENKVERGKGEKKERGKGERSEKEDRKLASFEDFFEETGEEGEGPVEIQEKIEGEYVYDYNILRLHEMIIAKLKKEGQSGQSQAKQQLEIEKLKIKGRQSVIERGISLKKIKALEESLSGDKNNEKLAKYMERATPYIREYSKLGPITKVISFDTDTKENDKGCLEGDEVQALRHKIIIDYLEIARKHLTIDLVRKPPEAHICYCGADLSVNELIEDESGIKICPVCSVEKVNIIKKPFYSDGSRTNNSRNNYEDRANFWKGLRAYQGKQTNKPDKHLYEKLEAYFTSLDPPLPSMEEWKKLPHLPDGTKEGSSREMMMEALTKIRCTAYFGDLNLICSVYFDWLLPDIEHLEDKIMEYYDIFREKFINLPDKEGRTSSLNGEWTRFVLLRKAGWDCKMKDFKVPATPSILEYCKLKTKEIFDDLGWELPFTI